MDLMGHLAYQGLLGENRKVLKGQILLPPLIHLLSWKLSLLAHSVEPYIPRSPSAIRVMNEEVAEYLDQTRLPLRRLRAGLTVRQGYQMQQEFYPGYETITSLPDVNRLELDHWSRYHRDLEPGRYTGYGHQLEWNLWQDARYPVTNSDHTGRRAAVHAVDPANLGLPPQPDSRHILLYAYEGEELASVLEGNGFCFPGSDQRDCF